MHPVRTVKYAVTPKPVRKASRAIYTVTNPLGAVENALIGAALNGGHRRQRSGKKRVSTARATSTMRTAPPAPPSQSQLRAAEGTDSSARIGELMAVQRERFAPTVRPVIALPVRQGAAQFNAQGWETRKGEAHWWQISKRKEIRVQVALAADAHVEELHRSALAHHAANQQAADQWWAALQAGDIDVTRGWLTMAFADNPAPVVIDQLTPTTAKLFLLLPSIDVLPARQPYLTPAGRRSAKDWTQTAKNDIYAQILGAHLLATFRETWAVAPCIQSTRVLGVRDDL